MGNAARDAGVVARRIHLVVAIDRLLVRLLTAAPGQWVVKGGYANQLRRPDDARFTEDLGLKIDAAIETAPELLASGFAVDLADDFSYEVAASPAPLDGPPGRGLRFVVVARLAGSELVRFKVDVSAADIVVGEFESHFSDPIPRTCRGRRDGEWGEPWRCGRLPILPSMSPGHDRADEPVPNTRDLIVSFAGPAPGLRVPRSSEQPCRHLASPGFPPRTATGATGGPALMAPPRA